MPFWIWIFTSWVCELLLSRLFWIPANVLEELLLLVLCSVNGALVQAFIARSFPCSLLTCKVLHVGTCRAVSLQPLEFKQHWLLPFWVHLELTSWTQTLHSRWPLAVSRSCGVNAVSASMPVLCTWGKQQRGIFSCVNVGSFSTELPCQRHCWFVLLFPNWVCCSRWSLLSPSTYLLYLGCTGWLFWLFIVPDFSSWMLWYIQGSGCTSYTELAKE